MDLLKPFRRLPDTSIELRMRELERRQELLEDYTDQKLDSMKAYSSRILKRERDEATRGPRKPDLQEVNGVASPGIESPRVAALVARRARRLARRRPDFGASEAAG